MNKLVHQSKQLLFHLVIFESDLCKQLPFSQGWKKMDYQNGRKTPSFSYGDISPLSVKSSMDIDRKKFTLSIELDKHIQYNLNHEI